MQQNQTISECDRIELIWINLNWYINIAQNHDLVARKEKLVEMWIFENDKFFLGVKNVICSE